jgi:hypothetical protein
MALALNDASQIVRSIVRTIDKRVEFDAKQLAEGDRPALTGTLTVRRRSMTVVIPLETLAAASESPTRRHELRNTLKRQLDRMQFEASPVASTKMTRPSSSAEGFFRAPSSGRRGGKR